MRLVRVAKALGMTGQELRKELSKVDFGVKPADREVPDSLAHGIVRYLSQKLGIEVDQEALGAREVEEEEQEGTEGAEGTDVAEVADRLQTTNYKLQTEKQGGAPGSPAPSVVRGSTPSPPPRHAVGVLRKLTLEDVPRGALAAAEVKREKLTKAEQEERRREARLAQQRKKRAAPLLQEQIKRKEGVVLLPERISVKEFAEKTGVQVPQVIEVLMKNGVMATINQTVDFETAAIVASELGVSVQKEQAGARLEDLFSRNLEELLRDDPENLVARPPIVVVMGHVDHGKTSLLDVIRTSDVAAGEAGGITQRIGASEVRHAGKQITFLDTPGHEAFTAMRARGAQVGDIAIIVVAADEGVQEQTKEAIDHALEAGVPVLVAINKIDRPGADPERVKGELAKAGLQPEEWGGKTPVVLTSAVTKEGVTSLLDHVLIISEMSELRANPKRAAVATVIESHLHDALGPLPTVIVNTGTLRVGDAFVCGRVAGKVRSLSDAHGSRITEVPPAGAAQVAGMPELPRVGDILQVVPSEREARSIVEEFSSRRIEAPRRSFADLVTRLSEGKLSQLKVVLKAEAEGSLEAIERSLEKVRTEQCSTKVIHGGVGSVTESDVMMAAASDGVVLAFSVLVPAKVRKLAEHEGVEVREYEVIYTLLEEVEKLQQGLLEPEEEVRLLGHLTVLAIFYAKREQQIVGGRVEDGALKRGSFRILRGGAEVGSGRVLSLRHVDKDIKEAKEGSECGMKVETSVPVMEGDVLEVFIREKKVSVPSPRGRG